MRTVYTEVLAYTLRVMNLCIWVVVTEFLSSGEKGCPTGGVVAANIPGQCTLYPVGQSHGIAGGYPRPCPEISPSLLADIHVPVNSTNGWNLILQTLMTLIYNL